MSIFAFFPRYRARPDGVSRCPGGLNRRGALCLSGEAFHDLVRSVLARGALLRFRARGFSMSPLIRDGDHLTIAPPGNGRPGLGDVVAARHPADGRPVVHRLVARRGRCWLVKADNALSADGLVGAADIIGRVVGVERGGRRVSGGLGPERILLAALSRNRCLARLSRSALRLAALIAAGRRRR